MRYDLGISTVKSTEQKSVTAELKTRNRAMPGSNLDFTSASLSIWVVFLSSSSKYR